MSSSHFALRALELVAPPSADEIEEAQAIVDGTTKTIPWATVEAELSRDLGDAPSSAELEEAQYREVLRRLQAFHDGLVDTVASEEVEAELAALLHQHQDPDRRFSP